MYFGSEWGGPTCCKSLYDLTTSSCGGINAALTWFLLIKNYSAGYGERNSHRHRMKRNFTLPLPRCVAAEKSHEDF